MVNRCCHKLFKRENGWNYSCQKILDKNLPELFVSILSVKFDFERFTTLIQKPWFARKRQGLGIVILDRSYSGFIQRIQIRNKK